VFMMFYLQPYRKQTEGEPITSSEPRARKSNVSLVPAEHWRSNAVWRIDNESKI
jgi:hypothetical protein